MRHQCVGHRHDDVRLAAQRRRRVLRAVPRRRDRCHRRYHAGTDPERRVPHDAGGHDAHRQRDGSAVDAVHRVLRSRRDPGERRRHRARSSQRDCRHGARQHTRRRQPVRGPPTDSRRAAGRVVPVERSDRYGDHHRRTAARRRHHLGCERRHLDRRRGVRRRRPERAVAGGWRRHRLPGGRRVGWQRDVAGRLRHRLPGGRVLGRRHRHLRKSVRVLGRGRVRSDLRRAVPHPLRRTTSRTRHHRHR